jgi:hypothetical protein
MLEALKPLQRLEAEASKANAATAKEYGLYGFRLINLD